MTDLQAGVVWRRFGSVFTVGPSEGANLGTADIGGVERYSMDVAAQSMHELLDAIRRLPTDERQ